MYLCCLSAVSLLEILLPHLTEILHMHASAIAFIDILLLEYLSDILGIIIDDASNLPGELRILLLQALHLLVLQ